MYKKYIFYSIILFGDTMELSKRTLIFYIGLLVIYFLLSILTFSAVQDGLHLMLGWNVFLAFIPFIIVYILDLKKIKSKAINIVFILLWLLFFPNTIYIITDLIYIDSYHFLSYVGPYSPLTYLQNIEQYLALFHIVFGIIIGYLYGFKSLSVLYNYTRETKLFPYRDLITIGVFAISGLGVYIGRFFRYNSWDLLRVFDIVRDFFTTFTWFTIFFICFITLIQVLIFYSIKFSQK